VSRLRTVGESGFTLMELVIAVVIMGVITLPLANFVLQYFDNYPKTLTVVSDSHDMQMAAAYFSADVANTGVRDTAATNVPQRSVWVSGSALPAAYCGQDVGGSVVLLLSWDTATNSGAGPQQRDSVGYVARSGTLIREFCPASGPSTRTTVVHSFVYPDPGNSSPVTCSSTCDAVTPPATISLRIGIKGDTDTTVSYVTLTGQRRQT
jgi:prepilin-type N-terminal cleavage/methylation domain-containing protein